MNVRAVSSAVVTLSATMSATGVTVIATVSVSVSAPSVVAIGEVEGAGEPV
ncbi:MAG: hypothetical protein IPL11_05700 [Candidatus Accumulibacter sp.]|nr:hypothetical protein [Accumulibacter sp.]